MLDVYTMDSHYAQLTLTLNRFGDQIKKLERQREDIDAAVEVLREGIDWTRNRLKEMESAENDAEKSVEEFDRIARMSLDPEMADARTG